MGFREQNQWWVSPSNYAPEVMQQYHFAPKIEILDTSLRDGEQQPGLVFTRPDKVRLAKKLAAAGVHRIEAGTPAVSQEDADAIKEIAELKLGPKIFAFVRNNVKDIELAKSCGVDGVIAEVPGSEHLLKFGMKWTVDKAIKAAIEATTAAKEMGLYVTFFPADSSRASLDFLMDTLGQIAEQGHMDSLALVDTFGCFSPEGAAYTVRQLKERFQKPIEVHFHEDFGLGVATALAGLAAGAEVAHVTLNGIGERAGNVPLEPLVMALKVLYGYDTGVDLTMLKELSDEMTAVSGFPIQPTRPIVGNRIFGWETGMPSAMWLNCKDTEPLAMLPYLWTMTGQKEPVIYLGKKSGKDNVRKWLNDLHLQISEGREGDLLALVKQKAAEVKRDITPDEFKALVAKIN